MQISGTRFGTIDYAQEDILTIAGGLIGFPGLQNFVVVPHSDTSPFRWLQSVDEAGLAFLTVSPWHFFENYELQLSAPDADYLALTDVARAVLVTATIPAGSPKEMTVNLVAPVVVNVEKRIGKQVVVETEGYTIKHRVFQEATAEDKAAAA